MKSALLIYSPLKASNRIVWCMHHMSPSLLFKTIARCHSGRMKIWGQNDSNSLARCRSMRASCEWLDHCDFLTEDKECGPSLFLCNMAVFETQCNGNNTWQIKSNRPPAQARKRMWTLCCAFRKLAGAFIYTQWDTADLICKHRVRREDMYISMYILGTYICICVCVENVWWTRHLPLFG